MKTTTKETSLSALRHLLTAVGAIAVSRGYASESQATEIVGALVLLGGAIWGPLDEYLAARLRAAPPSQAAVPTVTPDPL